MLKKINQELIANISSDAAQSPRLRSNFNMHPQLEDPVQRFLNALQPGTYVQPHRHSDADRWELFIALRGQVNIILFEPNGTIKDRATITAGGELCGVEIASGEWHSLTCLQENTVLYESKRGPYQKVSDKDFASWAPMENDDATTIFIEWFNTAKIGEKPPIYMGYR